jgi:DNA adenine methylase
VLERLSAVHIEQDDAINVIKRWDSPQTLFYCDPPYLGAAHSYVGKYSETYHKALINTLSECKGSFVLSGYDNKYVPKHWEKVTFDVVMSATLAKDNTDKKRTECLWIVDQSENVRPEIRKLFDSGKFDCFPYQTPYPSRLIILYLESDPIVYPGKTVYHRVYRNDNARHNSMYPI